MERIGYLEQGQRVGLLGGSFDPPHEGHAHITRTALTRFGLDRVVWLVSPGNPLKEKGPAPMQARITAARALMDDPRVIISDFEARLGTRLTAETLARVRAAHRGVNFVWLMGADNLIQFDRWQRWHEIIGAMPVGVLARPGLRTRALCSKTAYVYRHARWPASQARALPLLEAPAWCFLNLPMVHHSSSAIRARGDWGARIIRSGGGAQDTGSAKS